MLSYTNRDYESILNDLKNEVKNLTPNWTDFNDADIGMVWLKTLAGVSSMLHYYIDKQANENYIGLAQEGKNIESILEILGYVKPLRCAAKSTLTLDVDINDSDEGRLHNNVIIPKYSQFSSMSKDYTCISTESVTITPFTRKIDIPVILGTHKSATYKNTYINSYKLYLPKDAIASDCFELIVDGYTWEKVDNAFLELNGGKKYSLHRDAYDSHYILFTNDYANHILIDGEFTINYIITNKLDAPAGVITNYDFQMITLDGVEYKNLVTLRNYGAFVGGFIDSDPLYERARIQKSSKVLDRLVLLEDYENFVRAYPGSLDVEVSDISVKNTTNPKPYQIDIFIIPRGGSSMSKSFKDDLFNAISSKGVCRDLVYLKDGKPIYSSVDITYYVKDRNHLSDSLTDNIIQTIQDKYKDMRFKKPLLIEDIVSTILVKFPQVYTLKVNNLNKSIYPNIGEYIVLNGVMARGEVFAGE